MANRVGQTGPKDFTHCEGNTRSKAAPGARTTTPAASRPLSGHQHLTPITLLDSTDCYSTAGKYCARIEFHLSEHKRRGFHTSQLIEYSLEPNPVAGDDKKAPTQKSTLAFSTADVVILGWRLGLLADKLRENDLAAIRVLPQRFAQVERSAPFVAFISITPIAKP